MTKPQKKATSDRTLSHSNLRDQFTEVMVLYGKQSGHQKFWLQSLIGWAIVGAAGGLMLSNVALRGKPWRDP